MAEDKRNSVILNETTQKNNKTQKLKKTHYKHVRLKPHDDKNRHYLTLNELVYILFIRLLNDYYNFS